MPRLSWFRRSHPPELSVPNPENPILSAHGGLRCRRGLFVRRLAFLALGLAVLPGIPGTVHAAPPGAPTGLSATLTSTQVTLSWTAPMGSNPAVAGYRIEHSAWDNRFRQWSDWAGVAADTGLTSITYSHTYDATLAPGVRVRYRVSAINVDGTGDPSGVIEATVPPAPDTAGNGAPDRTGITVDGDRVVITFDEALDASEVPTTQLFGVLINGRRPRADNVAVDGSTVMFTLKRAVDSNDNVRIGYRSPQIHLGEYENSVVVVTVDGALQDSEGNLVGEWTSVLATNNTLPTASDGTVRTAQGTAYTFTADDFNAYGDSLAAVKIVTLPASGGGALTSDGADVSAGDSVTKADIDAGKLKYTPLAGASGIPYTSFTFKVGDGTKESANAYAMTIEVTSNVVPTASDGTVSTPPETDYAFVAADFNFADANSGDSLSSVRIVTLPGKGSLTLDGVGVTADQVVPRADIDDGGLVFTPVSGEAGRPYTSFTFRVSDGTEESASSYTMTIGVAAVNVVPGAQMAEESARPVGLKVTAVGPASISLSWKPSPHEEERSGYGIYRCTASEDMPDCDPYDGLWLAYLETNTYTDNEITPGTTYRYQVAAGALGRKNLSTRTLTAVAQPTETSSAPSGLTVTEASESVIRLSWTAPEEDGRGAIEAYDIYRCNVDSSPDCSGGFLHLASRNPVLTHYKDNNDVETGTTYRYAVAAYRWTEDVVPWSNQVTALAQREVLSEPEISVADAQAGEGPDSMLTFSVTLDPVPSDTVNVDYATSDGTATAGQDYTAAGGTLTFSDGEAAKTVTVTVLDDSHDEGSETLTLTLSNASGARIADGQATGTIVNSDPMPKDWLARFGRTSAMQVVGIMNARFDEVAAPIPQLTLGGQPMYLSTLRSGQENPERPTPVAPFGSVSHDGLFPVSSFTSPTSAGEAAWVHQDRTVAAGDGDANPLERAAWRLLTGTGDTWLAGRRQFLSRSSFNLSLSGMSEEPDMPRNETLRSAGDWSVWGRGALTHFAGSDAEVRLSGDVLTGLMGLDYARNRWLAGVALSYSDGDGAYHSAAGEGDVSSVLVSIHPYLRYALTGRLSVWGVLGYGQGEMRLEQTLIGTGPEDAMKTDMSMGMGAAGMRGIVYATADTELALKSDVLWVRTSSEATAGLAAVDAADASRVRLLLAGSHRRALANGAMLTPNFELGVRYDDGDAEDGVGMELGGGLHYVDPLLGLTVETRARALLAHEDGSYEEWGLGGSVQVDPGRLRRGLSLRLDTDWGITDSRAEALWQRQGTAGLARQHGRDQGGRVRAELSYGLDVPWTYGILTPYSSVELADGGNRILRLGWRFVLGRTLSFSLDGERRETALLQPEHGLMLRLSLPW